MGVRNISILLIAGICLLVLSGVLVSVVLYRHNKAWSQAHEIYERLVQAGFPAEPPSITLYQVLFLASYTAVPAKIAMVCALSGLACILLGRRNYLGMFRQILDRSPSSL
jgi:hypothetical protein